MPEHGGIMPPAGWYLDVTGEAALRWWDGAAWTAKTAASAPVPTPTAAPPSVADDQPLTRRQLREQVGSLTVGEADAAPQAAVAVLDRPDEAELSSAERMRLAAGYAVRPLEVAAGHPELQVVAPKGSAQTLSGWFFALAPLWSGGSSLLVSVFLPFLDKTVAPLATLIVILVLTFGLARTDGKSLAARGYRHVSPGWVFVPLVYFILRVVRVGLRSVPMLVAWTLSATLMITAAALVVSTTLGAPSPVQAQYPPAPVPSHSPVAPDQLLDDPSAATAPLSGEDRAYMLSVDGMIDWLTYAVSQRHAVSDVECMPFPDPAGYSETTCSMMVDGELWDVLLDTTPDDPDTAWIIEAVRPRGGYGGDSGSVVSADAASSSARQGG